MKVTLYERGSRWEVAQKEGTTALRRGQREEMCHTERALRRERRGGQQKKRVTFRDHRGASHAPGDGSTGKGKGVSKGKKETYLHCQTARGDMYTPREGVLGGEKKKKKNRSEKKLQGKGSASSVFPLEGVRGGDFHVGTWRES